MSDMRFNVILNLFQDLIKKRSRNKSGMTLVSSHCEGATHVDMLTTLDIFSCHCEVPEIRHHVRQYSCALSCHCEGERSEAVAIAKSLEPTCHPEAIAEGSQKVNEMLKQVQHDKNFGSFCKVVDDKSHFPRPTGEGLRERGLSAHDEIPKQVRNDKYLSEAHSKHLFPYSPINLFTFKKAAFTLAEVLITLGIIGVVAAMTIPTLIADYQEKVMVTKVKQGHSQLMNAIQLYVAQNNCANMLCLFDTKKSSDEVASELATVLKKAKVCTDNDTTEKYCKNYQVKSNTPNSKVDGVYIAGDSFKGNIYLQNGISIHIRQASQCPRVVEYVVRDENGYDTGERVQYTSHTCAFIYLDVNNIDGPNQSGADVYRYDVKDTGKIVPYSEKLLNNALLYNKLEYTPYNIGDPVEED